MGYEVYNIRRMEIALQQSAAREFNKWKWARDIGIELILDIGANTGQFAETIAKVLPNARLISFEPISSCYDKLCERMSWNPRFKAYELALWDSTQELEFNANEWSPSSSALELAPLHKQLYPFAVQTKKEMVRSMRLDDLLEEIKFSGRTLIKMDVQGAESKVIQGGREAFMKSSAVMVEVSFWELYRGQALFHDIYGQLGELGYTFIGQMEQVVRPSDHLPVYADALFINRSQTGALFPQAHHSHRHQPCQAEKAVDGNIGS